MRHAIVLLALSSLSSVAATAAGPCRYYEPWVETVTGRIVVRTHDLGDPEDYPWYEGRRFIHYLALELDEPICVTPGPGETDPDDEEERKIRTLQLVGIYSAGARHWRDRRVTLTGQFYHAHTAHHFTPVLVIVRELQEHLEIPKWRKPRHWRDQHDDWDPDKRRAP